jgi:hypothetical protein
VAYRVRLLTSAEEDLRYMERHGRKAQATTVRRALDRFLRDQPDEPSLARKPLDPNPFGVDWELRLRTLRAFYDVDRDAQEVRVVRAGYKEGNDLHG